ncbi:MAG: hypothetical protein HZA78_09155 [Candidatus Schekmanbacteria bacterium]|nr:hypothetical protein [Candidatus Schekmanbacteria bacterium]
MLKKINRLLRNERGQGMTEYIIIVALIALAAIVIVGVYGDSIQAMFVSMSRTLLGQPTEAETARNAGRTAVGAEESRIGQREGLDNFED